MEQSLLRCTPPNVRYFVNLTINVEKNYYSLGEGQFFIFKHQNILLPWQLLTLVQSQF